MALPYQEVKQRNAQIITSFTELYNDAKQKFKRVSYNQIYFQLSTRFNLSEDYIRKIVKNYR